MRSIVQRVAGGSMKSIHRRRGLWSILACLALGLSDCGGGGGSTPAAPPTIQATVVSFPSGAVPPGFADSGFNTFAVVAVHDTTTGAPIASASVSINGISLAYVAGNQDYEAEMNLAPAESIALTVNAGGATYAASGAQFGAYPTISSPPVGSTWSTQK